MWTWGGYLYLFENLLFSMYINSLMYIKSLKGHSIPRRQHFLPLTHEASEALRFRQHVPQSIKQQEDLWSPCAGPQTRPLQSQSASLQVAMKTRLGLKSAILVSTRELRPEVFCNFFVCLSGLHLDVIHSLRADLGS